VIHRYGKLLTFFIFLMSISAVSVSAKNVWTVTSSFKLDPRLAHQLEDLAKRNRVSLQFVSASSESAASRLGRSGLDIELIQAESATAFAATLRALAGDSARDLTPDTAAEGYTIEATYENPSAPRRLRITAADPRGFHNAFLRIPQLWHKPASAISTAVTPSPHSIASTRDGKLNLVSIADFPSFPERGIVEGFYGKPWSHEDRLAMLRFEGQHAMNVYYYAPKDDPYHRSRWREPYPRDQLKRLGELVETAHNNFVDFCFAISPGLSMVYSSETGFADLTRKLDAVGKLGVSCFALFLDDVPQELQNPQDKSRFTTLAAAHVFVINKLRDYLKSESTENRLVVTPTVYTNEWGSLDYVRELGAGVSPDVPIVWTGTKVASPMITAAQAQEWSALLRRKPLVWDNFPVNDGIPWRVNLGPLRGRDPNLPAAVRGLFSNPMNQPRTSMIPLQTIAEYLWNSAAYDPDAARHRALTDQYGKDAEKRLAVFLSTYSDYWWDNNLFKPLFVEERTPFDIGQIRHRITQLQSATRSPRNKTGYRDLMRELAPIPLKPTERLPEVLADPAFRHQANQALIWRDDYEVLYAPRLSSTVTLDGDFAKWRSSSLYVLDQRAQIFAGAKLWRGPDQFSARFALGWDDNYLYVGANVTDPNLYQPYTGRDIGKGDVVDLILETAFRKHFDAVEATGDEYHLLFSAGDYAEVKPSVYSEEDYLAHHKVTRDYEREIKTAWKKTPNGFSGDIAIPMSWFDGGPFRAGYEIGVTLGAQKAFPAASAEGEEVPHILLRSKDDHLFPAHVGNPSSYQRLVLIDDKSR